MPHGSCYICPHLLKPFLCNRTSYSSILHVIVYNAVKGTLYGGCATIQHLGDIVSPGCGIPGERFRWVTPCECALTKSSLLFKRYPYNDISQTSMFHAILYTNSFNQTVYPNDILKSCWYLCICCPEPCESAVNCTSMQCIWWIWSSSSNMQTILFLICYLPNVFFSSSSYVSVCVK